MKSPFPGMDPFLEPHWLDVHSRLVHDAANAIQRQLPAALVARIGERLVVEEDEEATRSILPDVQVFEYRGNGESARIMEAPGGVAVAEPLLIRVPKLRRRETFVQIIEPASEGRVITLLEFISPGNKLSRTGRRLYSRKRAEAIDAEISFVEIDLTRAGEPVFRFNLDVLPRTHRTQYHASIWRSGNEDDRYEVYPIPLRERLPAIRIPLRPDDQDAVLDLQELVDRAYEEGRYVVLDYSRPLKPPLSDDDRAWATELLARHSEAPRLSG